jgi:alpha-amylase
VIAGVGYLICALGTPCIYYGTEQGFWGEGPGDEHIREAMFDPNDESRDFLNKECAIYREIAEIARVNRAHNALRFGRMYFREISGNGRDFGLPQGQPCTLAFSRVLANEEILVAYNTSVSDARTDCVIVDCGLRRPGDRMQYLYGGEGEVEVFGHPDAGNRACFVRLPLAPMQMVILK